MEETAWDTALAPHPAGCCKDRAAARPDLATAEEWGIFCGALPVLGRWGLVRLQHKTRPVPWLRADEPNQVWSWDISYLPTSVKGIWLYLYFAMDGGSGKVVACDVENSEDPKLAASLVGRACLRERFGKWRIQPLILYAHQGNAMRSATLEVRL